MWWDLEGVGGGGAAAAAAATRNAIILSVSHIPHEILSPVNCVWLKEEDEVAIV